MKKLWYVSVVIVILGLVVLGCESADKPLGVTAPDESDVSSAAKPGGKFGGCATIQDGTIYASTGELITPGYDKWGYNYQAHMFNGWYWNNSRPDVPWTKETLEAAGKSTTWLIMKWSDEWLSNKDCNGDGKLDRGYSCDPENANSSACEGAWLTNHQMGTNEDGTKWTYFVKIVYPPGGPVDTDNDGYDDITGGSIIWGSYVRIQQVSNDPSVPEHGNIFLVNPAGFGAYKP